MKKVIIGLILMSVSFLAMSTEFTGKGKIIFTQGHANPSCRTVVHKANATGIESWFRIRSVSSDDDIGAVILTALAASRDVDIAYTTGATTGCGTEPAIDYVTIY